MQDVLKMSELIFDAELTFLGCSRTDVKRERLHGSSELLFECQHVLGLLTRLQGHRLLIQRLKHPTEADTHLSCIRGQTSTCWDGELQRRTVNKYCSWVHFMSFCTLLEYSFFQETYDFNFTTFERHILYFSLHYISIKVLEVERCFYVAALKVSGWFYSSLKRDFLFFRQFISNHTCRATWSDFPAFFEHWPVVNVIFIYNNSIIRSHNIVWSCSIV